MALLPPQVNPNKGKSWSEVYPPETVQRMRNAVRESNRRRAHAKQ
jgi:hypothetical protein